MFIVTGLGNPGKEYEKTRHNAGRIILQLLAKKHDFSEWKEEGKIKALTSDGKIGKSKMLFVQPNNMMNNSGKSVAPLIKSKKQLGEFVVIYDDLDLPIGKFRISFNRSSGGHNGLESIIKNVKSEEFARIRVGISPITPSGKTKRPKGDAKKVVYFLMTEFKDAEMAELKKASKKISEALEMMAEENLNKAMSIYNQ